MSIFFSRFVYHHRYFPAGAQLVRVGGFLLTADLLDKPWSQVSSLLPPGARLYFVAHGLSIPTGLGRGVSNDWTESYSCPLLVAVEFPMMDGIVQLDRLSRLRLTTLSASVSQPDERSSSSSSSSSTIRSYLLLHRRRDAIVHQTAGISSVLLSSYADPKTTHHYASHTRSGASSFRSGNAVGVPPEGGDVYVKRYDRLVGESHLIHSGLWAQFPSCRRTK